MLVRDGCTLDFLNGVVQAQQDPETLATTIQRIKAHFAQRQLSFCWHIGPTSHPHNLGQLLKAHGLSFDETEPAMALDLQQATEEVPSSTRLNIQLVTNREMVRQWAEVWGCGAPREVTDQFFQVYSGLPLGPTSPYQLYLGLLDNQPVATFGLFLAGGVASIRYVITIHEARRQGIGTTMTAFAIQEARRLGYRIAILTASPMGFSIYHRLGFRAFSNVSTYIMP
ncbi:GNAT family N-acetyltransferase [Dictyobacter kobayashii]|uniref:N-acetyltransferase domain-containing protein n=1 Tax=Dictyobacter kobayashii TaxID=2014872 RepID=A0A402AQC6_9CHLR|nr:GNAT family N-acetyltransferase [Dictyobacter kobayashii]GCE21363.1 hypothetical protein KDK_51630 [Dictyobacter kobayashii]